VSEDDLGNPCSALQASLQSPTGRVEVADRAGFMKSAVRKTTSGEVQERKGRKGVVVR